MKMLGDYGRNIADVSPGYTTKTKDYYQQAMVLAEALPATDPIKLGLALNFSVFVYGMLKDTKTACQIAEKAFDGAMADRDRLEPDSTRIMQLMQDNLSLWKSEAEDEDRY